MEVLFPAAEIRYDKPSRSLFCVQRDLPVQCYVLLKSIDLDWSNFVCVKLFIYFFNLTYYKNKQKKKQGRKGKEENT